MGKGTIVSGGTDGQYQLEINFYREKIDAEIAELDVRITALEERIALMEDGPERNAVKLQKKGLEKRKEFLENNIPEDETISAWCADFSEKLTGNVGTVEVPGERGTVLIQPGFEDNAAYSQSRDGQLLSAVGASPEQYFYNLAMLPGWQKWKPTFRFGVIDSRDGDTADVTLEAATSSQQSIDVNQTTTLTSVPIEYMACNGSVFEPGDAVLIMFENQNWDSPKIIGFKDNPKVCVPWIVVKFELDIIGEDNTSFVWDIEKNAFATTIPNGSGGFVSMPCQYSDLEYWLTQTNEIDTENDWNTSTIEAKLLQFRPITEETGSEYIEHTDYCGDIELLSYIARTWINWGRYQTGSSYHAIYRGNTLFNSFGACISSKTIAGLNYVAHISEEHEWERTETGSGTDRLDTRIAKVKSPIGTDEIYDITELNRPREISEAMQYQAFVIRRLPTVYFQLYFGQVREWHGTYEKFFTGVISSIYVSDDVDKDYHLNSGVPNNEFSNAIKQIVADKPTNSIQVQFRT